VTCLRPAFTLRVRASILRGRRKHTRVGASILGVELACCRVGVETASMLGVGSSILLGWVQAHYGVGALGVCVGVGASILGLGASM